MRQGDQGAEPSAYPLAVIGTIGAVAQNAVGELVAELSSFTKFRDPIDVLLHDLKASPAAPGKVCEETIGREKFGGGNKWWTEAEALHVSYSAVIKELEGLPQLLSGSIEGMSIAALASHKGYATQCCPPARHWL
ncbi:hypothetical protein [Streptomyces sp. NPDC048155]|uniref:hypothetical protein n=1 Tax=Streptomyces sp. NPDC048155 TaxID=3154818 RepID=UPI0033DEA68D